MFESEAFRSDRGLGKVALAAFGLGVFMALHVSLLLFTEFVALADPSLDVKASLRWRCLEQWSWYALALGFFHLMEFMLTAAYRPTNVSYECMFSEKCCGKFLTTPYQWQHYWQECG